MEVEKSDLEGFVHDNMIKYDKVDNSMWSFSHSGVYTRCTVQNSTKWYISIISESTRDILILIVAIDSLALGLDKKRIDLFSVRHLLQC